MTHSAVLIAAGALLTFVLAALVFTPTVSAEERRLRDVQRLLRALEAQRRVREAKRRREARRPARQVARDPVPARDDRTQRRKHEDTELAAAARAPRAAETRAQEEELQSEPALVIEASEEPKPLTELPLFSWASRIEREERPQR